jgi:hypothetical protein
MAAKIETPREVRLASLVKFYADPANLAALTDVLKDRQGISLRVLDWLVTNYCKKRNIVYVCDGHPFNMWANYKAQLRGFSKSLFDPFKRRNKKRFSGDDKPTMDKRRRVHGTDDDLDAAENIEWTDADGATFVTTVGQLNFFKWAIEHGVLKYCIKNAAEIENDMHMSTQHRYAPQAAKRGRRSELSKVSVIKSCSRTRINVTLAFDCH